jgi:Mn2+/Fe2+ NRAMP family transporter
VRDPADQRRDRARHGRGLAGNLRRHYPAWVRNATVGLLVVANTINIGADLGAMGAALKLLLAGPLLLYVAAFGFLSVVLEVFLRYSRYVSVLKWLTLSLFAYVATVFVVGVPWGSVFVHLLVPQISWRGDYLTVVVAIFGTTISPYLFFWQAGEEVEDMNERAESASLLDEPSAAPRELRRIRIDTYVGMGLSNIVALFIVWTTAATLHAHGITNIQTSSQAAGRPVLKALGWLATAVMALAAVGMFAPWGD